MERKRTLMIFEKTGFHGLSALRFPFHLAEFIQTIQSSFFTRNIRNRGMEEEKFNVIVEQEGFKSPLRLSEQQLEHLKGMNE